MKCLSSNFPWSIIGWLWRRCCRNHSSLLSFVLFSQYFVLQLVQVAVIPYILESNPHPNLIRTSVCRFLKRKKSYFAVLIRTFPSTAPCAQLLQKSGGGCWLHGKPSRWALSSDPSRSVAYAMIWTDPKMTFYGRMTVKMKMIVTGWRIRFSYEWWRRFWWIINYKYYIIYYIL